MPTGLRFIGSLDRVNRKIAEIRAKYAGVAVTSTEPVFGYMAFALGLKVRNERFQMAVMNDTEPSAREIQPSRAISKSTR